MCGRFAFYSPAEAVTRLFGVEAAPEVEPRYNLAPTQFVPAVRADAAGKRSLGMLRWGLIPFWAKDKKIGNRMINARAETVQEKPAYRAAFKRRRCLVLANGFYEWQRRGSEKVPHFIGLRDEEPFAMAGLWERWRDKADEAEIESCTIVTTSPNELAAAIHDRMPAILRPEDYAAWLDPGFFSRDALAAMLAPYPADAMQAFPVSRRVNSPRNDDESLIARA